MEQESVKATLRQQGRGIAWLGRQLGVERTVMSRKLDGQVTVTDREVALMAVILGIPRDRLATIYGLRIREEREPQAVA